MSIWIDRKYLLMVSNRLKNFKQKGGNVFQFRCPFCNDSRKSSTKSRGYFYPKNTDLVYSCHNCGVGTNVYNFLQQVDSSICKDYSMEVFKEKASVSGKTFDKKPKEIDYKPTIPNFNTPKLETGKINLDPVSILDDEHIAKKYVMERKIPKGCYKDLFYAEDFKKFIAEFKPEYEKELISNDPRLIIPFRDINKKVFALQGRSLNGSKLRYITIKLNDSDTKIFGLDRVDQSKRIYVTEGPIDSLFLNNAVATADSNLRVADFLGRDKLVLVYDNEPRNPQIVKQIQRSIEEGFRICLFPDFFKGKDINDAILNGFTKPEIQRIIDTHTYEGLRARMEFNNWKKC